MSEYENTRSPKASTDELLGVSIDAFIMMDLEGRIVDWSPHAEVLFGWTKQEVQGELLGSLIIPPQHRDAHWNGLERYRATGESRIINQRVRLTAINRAQEEFPVEFTITPIRIGERVHFFGVIRGLADREAKQARMRQRAIDARLFQQATTRWWSAETLEAALQDCVEILCDISGWPVGHALVFNPRTERLKCADVWHLDNKRYEGIYTKSRHQTFGREEGLPGRIWTAGETVWSAEIGDDPRFTREQFAELGLWGVFGFPIIVEGETVAVLEFFSSEALAPDPQLLMQVSSLSTQLTRTVEKRRWEAERLRLAAIVDSSYDAIISKDADGTIVSWNAGAEQIYGHQADEAIGQPISLILPDTLTQVAQEEPELKEAYRTGQRLIQFETHRKHKDGRLIPVALTMTPLRDSKGRIVGSSMIERDMSDRRKREVELSRAKEQAELANRLKSEFLANISHELRTPMNAIIGMLELSLAEDLDPILEDYLTTARDSADTLLYLLNDLLDFSRMEAGRLELEEEAFSLRETIDGAVKTLALRAHEKGIELAARIDPAAPDRLLGDGHRLRQVLINLVSNAIKFTEQGEVTVTVSAAEQLYQQAKLQFLVKDTGVGIAKDDRERIFHPFTQLDASTTRKESGTGLGLAICQELIHKMGGKLALESELDQGSTFHFSIRFPVLDPIVQEATPLPILNDLPVLVVDDNDTNRTILDETLTGWGMKTTVLDNGEAALQEIRRSQQDAPGYQLVIVDALMPGMDGFTLIETLHEEGLSELATVLMVSSSDRQTFKDRCEDLEIAAYLEKPISQSDMLEAVMTALKGTCIDDEIVNDLSATPITLDILLAEDTPANQKVIKTILNKRGHQVDIAHNGREAIELHKQNEYDLILMDVQMPTVDGLQATEAIRELDDPKKAKIIIVAMTAHARREDRQKCMRAGMSAYIAKPIDSRRLLELVESMGQRGTVSTSAFRTSDADMSLRTQPADQTSSVMNRQAALERLGGKEDLLCDLMNYFLEDSPGLLQSATDGISGQDAEQIERAAHSLRGLAANFDAAEVVSAAETLEQIGKSGKLAEAPSALSQLQEALRRLTNELQNCL